VIQMIAVGDRVPHSLALDLRNLPQMIAELEETTRQIKDGLSIIDLLS
jgi:hypothetical protein